MIVDALHPAAVFHVPRRARVERFELAACRSPVELREDDLSRSVDVGPLFPGKGGTEAEPMRLLDGRLWTPVVARDGAGPFREAGLGEFVDWISGGGDPDTAKAFERQFSCTPLVALSRDDRPTAMVMFRGPPSRGVQVDLSTSRNVIADGGERARLNLDRYVADEIRILDGRPFMRSSPLMRVDGVSGNVTLRVDSRTWPADYGMRAFPALPGTLDLALAVQRDMGVAPPDARAEAEARRWAGLVPDGALEGDDVRYLVNAFAEPIRRSLDIAIASTGVPALLDRLEKARHAMLVVEIGAMTGTAHLDGDVPVLAMREALDAWIARRGLGSHGQQHLAAFLHRVVIPRMATLEADDAEALGTMGP